MSSKGHETLERAGRPRDPAIDAAVLEATLAVLDDVGYVHFTVEETARRAGATKPAIYRRWASRPRLVLAALGSRLEEIEPPSTGCTLCDLDECLKVFVAVFRTMPPDVLAPLHADCAASSELRREFMTRLFEPPRVAVRRTLAEGHERADLRDDVDLDLIVDLAASFIYYRALFAHAEICDVEIERAVQTLLRGIAVDYERLVEHTREAGVVCEMHRLHAEAGGK